MDVLLTRVFAINTPIMKIGLGFMAVALCAALYGPWWSSLVAALADIAGSLIFPTGAYFPGFTLTAALTGIIFGLCLYKKKKDLKHAVTASALNVLIVTYIANSAMISYVSGTPYVELLKIRAIQLLIMLPIQIVMLRAVLPAIMNHIPSDEKNV